MATACLNEPVLAFQRLEHDYIHQHYELLPGQKRPTADFVSERFGESLQAFYGGRIGDALVGLGVLRPIELFRAIASQVRFRLLEAFRWRTGEWAFVPDLRSHEETFPLGIDSLELIREAVAAADVRELFAALLPSEERVLVTVAAPPVPRLGFTLPAAWEAVLDSVRGEATPKMLIERHVAIGGDADDAYRALFLGLSCGLIKVADR